VRTAQRVDSLCKSQRHRAVANEKTKMIEKEMEE
jgi:hypothetical protein